MAARRVGQERKVRAQAGTVEDVVPQYQGHW